MRRGLRLVCAIAVAAAVMIPTVASAQLPPPPAEVPPLPEPIPGTLLQVLDATMPTATMTAEALAPVAVASGFVFRPGCSTIGTALVAVVLGGAYIPVPANMVGQAVGPLLVYCAYTYAAGPADPVFLQTDAAVGPTLTSTLEPVTAQVGGLIAPYRPQFGDACGYSPLIAAPIASIPAPLNRIDPLKILCG